MRSREIRRSFLEYFERHGHTVVPSSPLVPGDDPTLLFTNAGMNQFKDVFLGKETRGYTRAATSQKCMRVSGKHNDLDTVGPSLRHHTFFEMLGNFSFGDYFKKEGIEFAWELLTREWALPADRLYPTIFMGESGIPRDEQAHAIWTTRVPSERITELGLAENFWSMGETGPCGRCSEIHYFRGPEVPCEEERTGRVCRGLDCSCDRFVEIWNNVFMEFERQADGTLHPLPAPSIDTGMGLERITAVIQGKLSNYDTDVFTPILQAIGARAGRPYGASAEDPADVSMRVIADHLRAMTFLIADGVVPSNEWRGYVLRKIMRRAMRHAKKLGLTEPVLHTFVDVVAGGMEDAYPELRARRDDIARVVRSEEERFDAVLTAGLPRLEEVLDRAAAGTRVVAGEDAFRLYDSLGVPYDFMDDLASQRQIAIDRQGYERAMEGQREKARAGSAFKGAEKAFAIAAPPDVENALARAGDQFAGYEGTTVQETPVVALFDEEGRAQEELTAGARGYAAIGTTPFYVEAGGQVSDTGRLIANDGAEAAVERMARQGANRPRLHVVRVERGALHRGQLVTAEVNAELRDATRRNHTGTHLLHAALRQVLGAHVKQAGSLVAPDRLRFDFAHFSAVTREQLDEIERIVNAQIYRNARVQTEVRSTEEAIASGAMALFGEKYGDRVRVVSVPGFSVELCGGTHVRATGDIGFFTITEESGVAAGVRRIEALTGAGAVALMQQQRATLQGILGALNVTAGHSLDAIHRLQSEVKRLGRELDQVKMKLAMGGSGASSGRADDTQNVDGVKLVARRVEGLEKAALRGMSDSLRDRLGTFAAAGGRDPSKIDELLARASQVLSTLLR
ncbi:MAG: alanine--tRNA ligase [Acidobacteria bacterium]|nr:alanine--tRNA ligase [Acidobacteriota bacterium]